MKKNLVLVVALLALIAVGAFAQKENDFEIAQNKQGGITITTSPKFPNKKLTYRRFRYGKSDEYVTLFFG